MINQRKKRKTLDQPREVAAHNFKWCEQTGRISNFAKAAGLVKGKFEGIYFNDSDVYKVLEGACYSLADHPDPKLEKIVDDVVAKIAAAQQPDGYVNTYYTLVEPDKRWTNCASKHELYCAGHLFEAAVAHYRATGKRTLPRRGHEVRRLHRLASSARTSATTCPATRRSSWRWSSSTRPRASRSTWTWPGSSSTCAATRPSARGSTASTARTTSRCASSPRSSATRSAPCTSTRGVADVAGYTGDRGYVDAMDRLWQSVAQRKMYLTGGIGVQGHGEGFSGDYELPNAAAYCETCAAIGMALWNHRLNLMHGDAKYADVVERELYNGILSGVDLGGEKYFYVNPLESGGGHHRQPFYGCACCPTNVVRLIPSVPGYVYATDERGIYVNLYVAGTGKVPLAEQTVTITQETRYPWEGDVKLTVTPEKPGEFAVNLRMPGWCQRRGPCRSTARR